MQGTRPGPRAGRETSDPGNPGGLDLDRALPAVYDELRSRAARLLAREPRGTGLQPTALVHEAYLRLADGAERAWAESVQLLPLATLCMRHVLCDEARRRAALKRGGGRPALPLESAAGAVGPGHGTRLLLRETLRGLEQVDPRKAQVAELRLAGHDRAAIAAALGVSEPTVQRDWRLARAWLLRSLQDPGD